MQTTHESQPMPGVARYLGYGGVLPFAAMALNHIAGAPLPADFALKAFLFYSAAILSFLGGIRWGSITTAEHGLAREMVTSVIPSLWAVVCLLLNDAAASVWCLLAGFALMGAVDYLRPSPGLAIWMRQLRLQLTIAVVACHIVLVWSLRA